MMRPSMFPCTALFFLLLSALLLPACAADAIPIVQETEAEFIASADLNGDGLADGVLVDKATGRVRPGYRQVGGLFNWGDWRASGASGITGLSIGRFFSRGRDGLAFASRDGNLATLLDLQAPSTVSAPVEVPFMLLGPATIVAIAPTTGSEGWHGLFIGSVYNSPEANVGSLFLNANGVMEPVADLSLPGIPTQGNRLQFLEGSPEFLGVLYEDADDTSLSIQSFANGQLLEITTLERLGPNANYTWANVRGTPQGDLLVWESGTETLRRWPVKERGELGRAAPHNLGRPIRSIIPLTDHGAGQLFVIHTDGTTAGIYKFDADGRPTRIQSVDAPQNLMFSGAVQVEHGFIAFQSFTNGGSSVRYQWYQEAGGTFQEGIYGRLPSLADDDKLTIPDIRARIAARHQVSAEAAMQAYTNTIPGTKVTYSMAVIPGGTFVMGSPEQEPGRQPDEGPQRQVRLDPFWMGQFEVTWNEFELFMYPDQEKKMREGNPSGEAGDTLADAVSHPSKPYADMTFGMGRQGYPAIAMTQHAANKYCQWLSAKTGHFYRLPTEAEWEYAARAGSSTPYFFGDDDSALEDYAWYEMNSDFKYQKVGRKKPNPWGLHDVYGNVLEWVLDQYDPRSYALHADMDRLENPWNKATQAYPHSVRGGSWDDPAAACRSGARRGSDPTWKLQDPQLPKSTWYFTDADFIGFRLVRPLAIPDVEAMQAYWNSGVERE